MRVVRIQYTGEIANGETTPVRLDEPLWLVGDSAAGNARSRRPRLVPAGAGAALLVPPGVDRPVLVNGVPVNSRMQVLQHAHRVDFDGATYWVAAVNEVQEVAYDPAVHGEDQFCFMTRVRLRVGEMVVVCPGCPGVECAAIYRQAAWEMAIENNARFRCLNCRFEPSAAEWRPPVPARSRLSRLLELAQQVEPGASR